MQNIKINEIIDILVKNYGHQKIALRFANPFELLIATILSAQCTDKQVNEVTKVLFAKYPDPKSLGNAAIEDIESIIRSTGFYHNKSLNIIKTSRIITEKFNGKTPDNMVDLLKLAGVARKTANIVLYNSYGIIEGIAVDTHVKRLSKRLGFSNSDNPDKIEKDLMNIIPRDLWGEFTYMLITHGRQICDAKKPKCDVCFLCVLCPSCKK